MAETVFQQQARMQAAQLQQGEAMLAQQRAQLAAWQQQQSAASLQQMLTQEVFDLSQVAKQVTKHFDNGPLVATAVALRELERAKRMGLQPARVDDMHSKQALGAGLESLETSADTGQARGVHDHAQRLLAALDQQASLTAELGATPDTTLVELRNTTAAAQEKARSVAARKPMVLPVALLASVLLALILIFGLEGPVTMCLALAVCSGGLLAYFVLDAIKRVETESSNLATRLARYQDAYDRRILFLKEAHGLPFIEASLGSCPETLKQILTTRY